MSLFRRSLCHVFTLYEQRVFLVFARQLAQTLPTTTLVIADKASTHQSSLLTDTSIVLQHLPTACPELNPVERVFEEIRRKLANRIFYSLQQAEQVLTGVATFDWRKNIGRFNKVLNLTL
jgi:transposase